LAIVERQERARTDPSTGSELALSTEKGQALERAAAYNRAFDLLYRYLTPEQREQLASAEQLRLTGSSGLRYVLGLDRMVVVEDPSGAFIGHLCVGSRCRQPAPDVVLTLLLYAQFCELAMWRAGNFYECDSYFWTKRTVMEYIRSRHPTEEEEPEALPVDKRGLFERLWQTGRL
jgi:hypothetical protein